MSESVTATVVILTYNSGPRLAEVLAAVANQITPFDYETMVIDSGSTDGTVELVRSYGVRFLQIEPGEFQHGRTRNLAVELAEGEFVALLTHDATPASPFWLRDLVGCFDLDPKVAAVFGKHLPRPDCDVFAAREILMHFRNFGPDDRPAIQELKPGPDAKLEYLKNEALLGFFSDVNGCIRRSVWEQIPYRELDYAEDQRLGRDLLEAGYKKVYSPTAAVYHSHALRLRGYFRRMHEEFLGMKKAVGYIEQRSLPEVFGESFRVGLADAKYARSLGYLNHYRRAKLGVYGLLRAFLRRLAAYMAARDVPVPRRPRLRIRGAGERRTISYLIGTSVHVLRTYGFAEFRRVTIGRLTGRRKPSPLNPKKLQMPFVGVDPAKPAPLLAPRPVPKKLTLNWVTPPFGVASGGHMTIARIIRYLESFGHRNRIYLYHASDWMTKSDPVAERKMIRSHFQPIETEVFIGVEEMDEADALIATSWETAYLIHGLSQARARCYFVQDFEPYFHPVGSNFKLAENTYRFGYHCFTAGAWLDELLRERYQAATTAFDLAPDHDVYRPASAAGRDDATVIFYGRWKTERRGFELAAHAFEQLCQKLPDVRILIFGAESLPKELSFPHRNLGVMPPAQLARLYNRATVGFVISLTNPSLVPLEMMACGLPVVDIDSESTRTFFGPNTDLLALADPYPSKVADVLAGLLSNSSERDRIARRGVAHVSTLNWERSARQVEEGLIKALSELSRS